MDRRSMLTPMQRYMVYGALFGCCFPVFATLLDILMQGMPLTVASIVRVQATEPLHWVIDTAPFFLGLFAGLAGQRQARVMRMTVQLEQMVADRTAELRRQKQYFETLVQNSPVAIVTLDLDHRIATCNPAFEKLFGYSQTEVIGQNLDELIATEAMQTEAEDYTAQVTSGEVVHGISQRRRKDGTLVRVELFGVPVSVEGEQIAILALYHDITELVRAREEAEAAAQAKSEFLANMSHEIRTPLNAVIGMTGLLLDTDLSHEQHDFTATIRTSGDALLSIINDILDFSKIEAGKLDLENQPFNLRHCVEEALDLVATRAAEKDLELAYLMDDQVPPAIVGDVTRLRQILVNLLNNAVKFTDEGEVVVRVTCSVLPLSSARSPDPLSSARSPDRRRGLGRRPSPNKRRELHFAVRDTGIGIPEDRMERLFRSFSQVDASTTRKYGGTGLGLAISRRLAQMMGGAMWVESEVGVGSTFHFTTIAEVASEEAPGYLRNGEP